MLRLIAVFLLLSSAFFNSQQLQLIPYPQKVEILKSEFIIPKTFILDENLPKAETEYFKKQFTNVLNFKIGKKDESVHLTNTSFPSDKKLVKDEYAIKITSKSIEISSQDDQGYFLALQTLTQLIKTSKNGKIQAIEIHDYPQFGYRGMHLDVVRHFFTVDEVKRYLDYLAMYKYNKFHWHLTDDQGWRIEIKKYPKLTEIGAWRKGSQIGPYSDMKFDDKKYGGFYTQEHIKDVVSYAKKLHIDVIPEIEMPGHAVAAIASYPELSCLKGNFEVGRVWGVEDNIFCPKEETFTFLENVLEEVMNLFPYEYVHIGGDEAPKTVWKESEFCQNLIKKLGLKDEHELQSYFISRIEKYVNSKGKKIIGWDEILQGGLAPNATVMSWTGIQGGIEAAKTGHKAIMTPTSTNYFDYYQGNPETEPLAFGGDLRLEKVYQYQPIPSELNTEQSKYIWGTQGNLWTEYVTDFKHVQHMIFPRMMALSEVAWGTSKAKDYTNFENRVIEHFKILDDLNINYSTAIFEVDGSISQSSNGKLFYQLKTAKNLKNIRFTTDGSDPENDSKSYSKPLEINKTQTIRAAHFENGKKISADIRQDFNFSKSTGKKIELLKLPSEAYSTGGALTLVDGIKGNSKTFGKNWLGFFGNDCVATINLGNKTEISTVQFSTLERKGSWIYLPEIAKIYKSEDGKIFNEIKSVDITKLISENGLVSINFPKQNAKFIKLQIRNYGIIPKGENGAGNPSWLFVDEISVN